MSSHPRPIISFIIGDYLVKVPKNPNKYLFKCHQRWGLPLLKIHMSSMSPGITNLHVCCTGFPQEWMARCAPSMSPNPGTTNCLDPGQLDAWDLVGWVLGAFFRCFLGGLGVQYLPTTLCPTMISEASQK